MVTPKQIRDLLQARPFKPFRICLSDGTHDDIPHHDMALVTKNAVGVGPHLDAEGLAESVARCSIQHSSRLEALPEAVGR